MPTSIKLTEEESSDIFWDDHEEYNSVYESDWVQEHKYQFGIKIVQNKETKKFYQLDIGRSGSYHTDWYYNYPEEMYEVKLVQETKVIDNWVRV